MWSCQKSTIDNTDNDIEEITRIENALNIKLEEANEEDLENLIFIPYEQLQEWASSTETLSRNNPYLPSKNYSTSVTNVNNSILRFDVWGVNIALNPGSIKLDFNFTANTTSSWSTFAKVDYMSVLAQYGAKLFPVTVSMLENEYNPYPYTFGFKFLLKVICTTKINGKPYRASFGLRTNVRMNLNKDPAKLTITMPAVVTFQLEF